MFFVSSGTFVSAQAPIKLWDKTIGGHSAGYLGDIRQTSGSKIWDKAYGGTRYNTFSSMSLAFDDGFVLGGWSITNSPTGPFDFNYTIIKMSPEGIHQWTKRFAGPDENRLYSVEPTPTADT